MLEKKLAALSQAILEIHSERQWDKKDIYVRMCMRACVFVCANACAYLCVLHTSKKKKVKLATLIDGDPKAPFSIATTPRCMGGCYSIA